MRSSLVVVVVTIVAFVSAVPRQTGTIATALTRICAINFAKGNMRVIDVPLGSHVGRRLAQHVKQSYW
jgi:hypothetical protein